MTGTDTSRPTGDHAPADDPVSVTETLRLRSEVRIDRDPSGVTRIHTGRRGTFLGVLPPGSVAALEMLASRTVTSTELLEEAVRQEGDPARPQVSRLLRKLRADGWLSVTVKAGEIPLLTLRPLAPAVPPVANSTGDAAGLRLSRFAVLRTGASGMILESPLAHVAVDLHDAELVGLLASLPARHLPERETCASTPARDCPVAWPEAVPAVLSILSRHGFLVPHDADADADAGSEQRFAQWSPHELLFHSRSRLGRHDLPHGGTYWAQGIVDPLPAVRAPFGGPAVQLPPADLRALRETDRTLTDVLEDRQSLRVHDDSAPLTIAHLGEFLYRSARNRRRSHHQHPQEPGDRPYPSGGSAYELELYPLINRVDGIAPGLYHYDPEGHRLESVAEPGPTLTRLAEMSRVAAQMTSPPHVTFFVTARFGRVMWKYSSMGYAMTLKHVGVLYQVMYCVATAMGLASCALGSGDSDAFAAASGLSWETESTVGEFLLGSRKAGAVSDR